MNIELMRRFAILETLVKEQEAKLEALKSLRSKLGFRVFQECANAHIQSVQIEPTILVDGRPVTLFKDGFARLVEPDLKPKPNVKEEDSDRMIVWFETAENGAYRALVKKSVHPKTLESWVKARQQENKPLPDFIHVHNVETAKVKVKKGGK